MAIGPEDFGYVIKGQYISEFNLPTSKEALREILPEWVFNEIDWEALEAPCPDFCSIGTQLLTFGYTQVFERELLEKASAFTPEPDDPDRTTWLPDPGWGWLSDDVVATKFTSALKQKFGLNFIQTLSSMLEECVEEESGEE